MRKYAAYNLFVKSFTAVGRLSLFLSWSEVQNSRDLSPAQ